MQKKILAVLIVFSILISSIIPITGVCAETNKATGVTANQETPTFACGPIQAVATPANWSFGGSDEAIKTLNGTAASSGFAGGKNPATVPYPDGNDDAGLLFKLPAKDYSKINTSATATCTFNTSTSVDRYVVEFIFGSLTNDINMSLDMTDGTATYGSILIGNRAVGDFTTAATSTLNPKIFLKGSDGSLIDSGVNFYNTGVYAFQWVLDKNSSSQYLYISGPYKEKNLISVSNLIAAEEPKATASFSTTNVLTKFVVNANAFKSPANGGNYMKFVNAPFSIKGYKDTSLADALSGLDESTKRQIKILNAIGVIKTDEAVKIDVKSSVSREEFTTLLMRMLGMDNRMFADSVFKDVTADNPNTGAINMAYKMHLIDGVGLNKFAPQELITVETASKMILTALGYGDFALIKSEESEQYSLFAQTKGILDKVQATAQQSLTKSDVIKMLYNALEVDMLVQTGWGTNTTYSIEKRKNVLTEYLKIYKSEGIVTDNECTGLKTLTGVDKGYVKINGELLKTGTTNAKDFIGNNTMFYVKYMPETEDKVILYIESKDAQNATLRVSANKMSANITSMSNITYTDEKDNIKKILVIDNVPIIYNSRIDFDADVSILNIENGYIDFIDNTNDGVYDIISVHEFKNYVVKSVNKDDYLVYGYYNDPTKPLNLDATNHENIINITKKGKETDVSKIKVWDVVSAEVSNDGQIINAVVCSDKISGSITEISNDGTTQKVTINKKLYELSNSYHLTSSANKLNMQVGFGGNFYLDKEGRIAGVEEGKNFGSTQYGYLVNVSFENALSSSAKAKIFTKRGEMEIFNTAEKVKYILANSSYSGKDLFNLSAFWDKSKIKDQLITFKLNEANEISELNTYIDNTSNTFGYDKQQRFTLDKRYGSGTDRANFRINSKMFSPKNTSDGTQSYIIDSSTTIFCVPNRSSDGMLDDYYFNVSAVGDFVNDTDYQVEFYDSNKYRAPKCVIRRESVGINTFNSNIMLIDHRANVLNAGGEIVTKIYGIVVGKATSYMVEPDAKYVDYNIDPESSTYKSVDFSDNGFLKGGSIVRISTNSKGNINIFKLILNYPRTSPLQGGEYLITSSAGTNYYLYGNACQMTSEMFTMTTNPGISTINNSYNNSTFVYIFNSKTNKATLGKMEEVVFGNNDTGEGGNLILVHKMYDLAKTIIAYK